MKPLLSRRIVASLHPPGDSTIQRISGWPVLLFAALFFPAIAGAQMPLPEPAVTRSSVSGQFVVISPNPLPSSARPPAAVTNADFVQLDPALLAVSAERVKKPLWRELGIDLTTPWRGRIFLALHPAESPDENVTIISTRFADAWSYRVELPDVSSRTSLTRALTGALLLELANRGNSGDRSAEIPAWLTEGLTQQLLSSGATELILSPPDKAVNGLPENRTVAVEHGVDAFAKVRPALRDHPALTFEQLSWPDDAQLRGDDGGVYHASAQLFVNGLLNLNHGAEHLRAMLQMLPRYYNWQTAFRAAFAADFPQPIDLEKWWALQTVIFAAGDAGTAWTPAVSSGKLAEILSVPVEFRSASNSLPARAAISLQAVIRNFDSARQTAILQTKLRDLGLAQWRMAPQFAVLTDAYRRALADYLGGNNDAAPAVRAIVKRPQTATLNKSVADTVRKLDALDAQRRTMENSIQPNIAAKKPQ
jgi:hypothetical protein